VIVDGGPASDLNSEWGISSSFFPFSFYRPAGVGVGVALTSHGGPNSFGRC